VALDSLPVCMWILVCVWWCATFWFLICTAYERACRKKPLPPTGA
jgi:hypothetical protein